jgi:hypothetical protein
MRRIRATANEQTTSMDYTPQPVDTSGVVLPAPLLDLAEWLARNAHENWAAQRMADGWTYGPERDDRARQHPCLVAYEDLPEAEKEYDRLMALETIKSIVALGYRLEKDADGSSL